MSVLELLLGGALAADGELVWASPAWLVGLAVAAAGVSWLLMALRGGRSGRARATELALWAGALGVLVVALAGPRWVEADGRIEPGKLVVLVDGSASMGVQDDGAPRGAAVASVLSSLRQLGGEVEVLTFDEEVRGGAPTDFTGRGSDLGVALRTVADRNLGQQLRGIVVLTDGIDRGALRREVREASAEGAVPAGLLPSLPGPVTFLPVGNRTAVEDLAVEEVVSGGFAFLRTPFALTATLRGAPGQVVPVTLSREGRLSEKKTVTLDAEGRAEVAFSVVPREVGRFAWEVSVPVSPTDAVPGNNVFAVVVRVVRDRTRVLQVSGSPSYDQKFLRLFLKEDPSVDLVSFFILRTREDIVTTWSQQELALIEFPYERLFTVDLDSFDLVVLQNFNYAPYFERSASFLLENLSTYVREGGALVMTGGDRSFDLGDYANTPIADVLPVALGVRGAPVDEGSFRPGLTEAGRVHPITRLGATDDASQAAWARLPELDGLNLTLGLTPGSAVLLEHPTVRVPGGAKAPVVAVREAGQGRTMALTVDASWRWSFSEAAVGRGNQAYLRFWKNSLRWLVADPEDRRVVVTPSRENVLLGDEVRLVVRVRDAGYGPVAGAKVTGVVRGPGGQAESFSVETGGSGEATTTLTPEARGTYRVVVRAGGDQGDGAETVFAVTARDPELAEIVPDTDYLEQLAELYGDRGAVRQEGDLRGPLLDDDAQQAIPDRREVRLAAAPLVPLLFGLLASGAWLLRRRRGAH